MKNTKSKRADSILEFSCGKKMKNRFALAPLTNKQSHRSGQLSDAELHWLTMRAKGQFGMITTCATNVQANGQCWPGQLSIHSDDFLEGHRRLAQSLQAHGSLVVVQIFHGGMRCPQRLIGEQAVCPSTCEKYNARALKTKEVEQLRDDFIAAAVRAKRATYDGVEIHGAHGYLIAQFLSQQINRRTDKYGGSLENRARLLFEMVDGTRNQCGPDFLIGVRLSPERFGMQLSEMKRVCQQLIDDNKIDFLDLSLWDCFKQPEGKALGGKSLLEHLLELNYKEVKLTVAGKIRGAVEVQQILSTAVDFVSIGQSAILHHDFPRQVITNPSFEPIALPVCTEYLRKEGLSQKFIDYMTNWKGFVAR